MKYYHYGLRSPYTAVIKNGSISYGGDQNWFFSGKGNVSQRLFNENCKIANYGCGLIAVTDTLLYLSQKNEKCQKEALVQTLQKFGQTDFCGRMIFPRYYQFVRNYNCNYHVVPKLGFNGVSMAAFVNGWLRVGHTGLTAVWGISEPDPFHIAKMLSEDLPVIMSVFSAAKNSDGLRLYACPFVPMQDRESRAVCRCMGHYFTVTGMFSAPSDTWLQISSWGKCYYISFREYHQLWERDRKHPHGLLHHAGNNMLHIQ